MFGDGAGEKHRAQGSVYWEELVNVCQKSRPIPQETQQKAVPQDGVELRAPSCLIRTILRIG